MSSLDEIKVLARTDRMGAAEMLGRGLMAGDPDTFKQGYSRENAVLATTDMLGLTDSERDTLRERLPDL